MCFFACLKLVVPVRRLRNSLSYLATKMANGWTHVNNFFVKHSLKTRFELVFGEGCLEALSLKKWYMVTANHQSWLDIVVLQKVLLGKIPTLKFFLKNELKWVPVMGLAWWGLNFPFMKRYSKALLRKKPHLRGKDVQATKKSCRQFLSLPSSVMIFPEGTRFSQEKKQRNQFSAQHLLMPRAGGMAYALEVMGKKLDKIIDVTIVYPDKMKTLWQFLCGKTSVVQVYVRSFSIKSFLIGDYLQDKAFQAQFKAWLNQYWLSKDALIANTVKYESLLTK